MTLWVGGAASLVEPPFRPEFSVSYRVKNRVDLGEERKKSVKNRERKWVFLFSVSFCECGRGSGLISSEVSVKTVDMPASIDGNNASSIDVLFKDKF
ncbi:hypothetical protein F2Q70_00029030 [Brassica cretica]|uniref:Uncharacterized protein n=1 Tax=Brassica cretica TaxID=69181 RepID=A0A8S9H5B0_BRACR|nr:hypothetical protein F2Q70_00029030 [Brassica cretica]KAF2553745.1 hypothetical protein F2Q68_00033414 [Brassica cretica]